MRDALLAEFDTPEDLVAAIEALRSSGHRRLQAFTPFIVHEAEEALGVRRSRLPYVIFAFGILGASGAYFLQWLLNAYLYPLDVGGRPPHMPLGFVPNTFEMGILLAGFAAFFGVLVKAGALRLHHPLDEVPGFERASIDRFFLTVDTGEPGFDPEAATAALEQAGALRVLRVGRRPGKTADPRRRHP